MPETKQIASPGYVKSCMVKAIEPAPEKYDTEASLVALHKKCTKKAVKEGKMVDVPVGGGEALIAWNKKAKKLIPNYRAISKKARGKE
jgi:hypothetical protein